MNKLIYISESQLNEIIGNGAYLNSQNSKNEYRLGGSEISVNGTIGDDIDGDLDYGIPITGDRIAKHITKPRVKGLNRTVLPESNQDLTGKHNTMQLSKNTIDDIKYRLNNYNGNQNDAGVKRAKTIIDKGRISNDDGYRILNDFKNNNAGEVLGSKLEKEIRRKLDTAEDISKSQRDAKMARGENILKSAPKTGMKGGAHSPKGKNIIDITYQ